MERISAKIISELGFNEIFVFGSNLSGFHAGGAAKVALDRFGAVYGQGIGLQGKCYAIPTLGKNFAKIDIEEIKVYVDQFISEAKILTRFNFLVTEIGCGIAGFTVAEIAPLFKECLNLENVYLPQAFIDFYNN